MNPTRVTMGDSQTIYAKFLKHPICGILDTKADDPKKAIVLFPLIPERTFLWEDKQIGTFSRGARISEDDSIKGMLSTSQVDECNRLGYAPRYVSTKNPLGMYETLSAHEYVVKRIMRITSSKVIANLRGFTVTRESPTSEPIFDWKSGALNSLRDEDGIYIEKKRGAKMSEEHQTNVRHIIKCWSTSKPSTGLFAHSTIKESKSEAEIERNGPNGPRLECKDPWL